MRKLVINLPSRPDRREAIARQFHRVGLSYELWPAVARASAPLVPATSPGPRRGLSELLAGGDNAGPSEFRPIGGNFFAPTAGIHGFVWPNAWCSVRLSGNWALLSVVHAARHCSPALRRLRRSSRAIPALRCRTAFPECSVRGRCWPGAPRNRRFGRGSRPARLARKEAAPRS